MPMSRVMQFLTRERRGSFLEQGFDDDHDQNVLLNLEQIFDDAEPQLNCLTESTTRTEIQMSRLTTTPSSVDSVQNSINVVDHHQRHIQGNLDWSQPTTSEKFKAANFPADLLRIGSYVKQARHAADLVCKIYYPKRKLIWEILDKKLKSKLEIQWLDILSLRATIVENSPGILEIELNQPPAFFRERDPKPRKQTNWEPSVDFTGGQASSIRRHYIAFPPGVLDKHYEKLLSYDERLFQLSRRRYPSLSNLYFNIPASNIHGINGGGGIMNPNLQVQFTDQPMFPSQQNQYENTAPLSFGLNDWPSSTSGLPMLPSQENQYENTASLSFGYNHLPSTSTFGVPVLPSQPIQYGNADSLSFAFNDFPSSTSGYNQVSPAVEGMAMEGQQGHEFDKQTWNDVPNMLISEYEPDAVCLVHYNNHFPVDGSHNANPNGSRMIIQEDSSGLLISTRQESSHSNAVVYRGDMVTHAADNNSLHPCRILECPIPTVKTNTSYNYLN